MTLLFKEKTRLNSIPEIERNKEGEGEGEEEEEGRLSGFTGTTGSGSNCVEALKAWWYAC